MTESSEDPPPLKCAYEVVQYLMDCCGITYNQAVQALRSNDWDLWQAEVAIHSNKM
ncbi:TPA: hypothetical protein JEW09_001534 [Escherichia coli]|nr:hypothetical protein [Escherichia coli]HCN9392892.1 hypothetical protein [Escherichia coli]